MVLLAHPMQMEPTFCRSVVLIYDYSAQDGAKGVILNKPVHLFGRKDAELDLAAVNVLQYARLK